MAELNDVFIERYTGELWYIKELADDARHVGYYRMADCYGLHPDRMLSPSSMEDMIKNKMLKFGWSAKDAKRWKT
jgi:hypothetical protein